MFFGFPSNQNSVVTQAVKNGKELPRVVGRGTVVSSGCDATKMAGHRSKAKKLVAAQKNIDHQ